MKTRQQHDEEVKKICRQIADIAAQEKRMTLRAANSNITRDSSYKQQKPHLDIQHLNQLIAIDKERQVAWVEPRITMFELHQALFKQGYIVPVLPEFKSITVGGAIMGAAIESSSFAHGQFNDICISYDVVLGNGELVHASATENSDIFYGIPGSYGTLGVIVLVQIKLLPATQWIELNFHSFNSVKEAIDKLISLKNEKNPPEFTEGIVYAKNHAVIIAGRGIKKIETQKIIPKQRFWSKWFYQDAKTFSENDKVVMSTTDYLFRHDRGAFWMGAYATHLPLFARYFLEGILKLKNLFAPFATAQAKKFHKIKDPGPLFRFFFGGMMPSTRLYKLLHCDSENWFRTKFVIQDFYIPENHATAFIEDVLDRCEITPLWLCPVKSTQSQQWLSPHYQKQSVDLIDVGVYGLPKYLSAEAATKYLEEETQKLGGRKMLYTFSFYTPEEFWNIYSAQEYKKLRQRTHAENVWLNITDKVLK